MFLSKPLFCHHYEWSDQIYQLAFTIGVIEVPVIDISQKEFDYCFCCDDVDIACSELFHSRRERERESVCLNLI